MLSFVVVSNDMQASSIPFVREVVRDVDRLETDVCYLVHGADLAITFDGFDFLKRQLAGNVYWFENVTDMYDIIHSLLPKKIELDVLMNVVESPEFFYLERDGLVYALSEEGFYHVDLRIMSRLIGAECKVSDIFQGKLISWMDMRVEFVETGYMDAVHDEDEFLKFMGSNVYPILKLYQKVYMEASNVDYGMDDDYGNPYENLIFVEDLLNANRLMNIDLDKCEDYDLKHDKLPAQWSFNGLHNTTGRIFSTSDKFFNLQSLPAAKRDVLYAPKGYVLVELDFKSFEYDILCQEVGMPLLEDPHTITYDELVGVEYPESRKVGKTINYAFIYGMNPARLAEAVMAEVPDLSDDFKEEFISRLEVSDIAVGSKELEERVIDDGGPGWIANHFGRKIRFKKLHAVLNNYISSTASDFLYNKIRHSCDLIEGHGQVLLQNHDSVLFLFSEVSVEATDVVERVLELFRSPLGGIVGRIEMKYGYDWAHME